MRILYVATSCDECNRDVDMCIARWVWSEYNASIIESVSLGVRSVRRRPNNGTLDAYLDLALQKLE